MTPKISVLVHALEGRGKSTLLDQMPGPRLILDAEGGACEWTDSPKIWWDPSQDWPTAHADGSGITTNTTIAVLVKDWSTVEKCYERLNAGGHYINTAGWDSITEIQSKARKQVSAAHGGQMSEARWGTLLDLMTDHVKAWRDLRVHPSCPINTFFTAISVQKDGRWIADIQGAAARKLPTYTSLVGYLEAEIGPDGQIHRTLSIHPSSLFMAKDNTGPRGITAQFGPVLLDPHMPTILAALEGAHS